MKKQPKERADPRPMCRVCGHRHWSYEPHVLPDPPKRKKKRGKKHG